MNEISILAHHTTEIMAEHPQDCFPYIDRIDTGDNTRVFIVRVFSGAYDSYEVAGYAITICWDDGSNRPVSSEVYRFWQKFTGTRGLSSASAAVTTTW